MGEQSEMADCFLWAHHDENAREAVLGYAKSKCQPKGDFIVLRTEAVPEDLRSRTLLSFFVETLRRAKCFPNCATTLLTVPEHYLALQLCVARVKQVTGPYDATGGEVLYNDLLYQQHLAAPHEESESEFVQSYVDFLAHSNTSNHWQVLAKFRAVIASDANVRSHLADCAFLVHGPIRSKFARECLSTLLEGRRVQVLTAETPLDASLNEGCDPSDVSVISERLEGPFPEPTPTGAESKSATDSMTHVVLAFLRVLVNSRDEVALATAMASPVVQLPHDAFTELKRLSLDRGMPMCQTAVSYVLRARLGGAPVTSAAQNCPLRPFLCRLSEFVDVLHKLQTFAEEEDAGTAVRKAVGLLVSRIRRAGGREVAFELALKLKTELIGLAESLTASGVDTEEDPGFGGRTLRVLRDMADVLSTRRLSCNTSAVLYNLEGHGTPLNVPQMLEYFKTPEPEVEDDEYCVPLAKRLSSKFDEEPSSPLHTSGPEVVCEESESKSDVVPPTQGESRPLAPVSLNIEVKDAALASSRAASKEPPKKLASKTKRNLMSDINNSAKRKRTSKATVSRQPLPNQKMITSFFVRS
ncbi:unnamed protein product [Ixodes hexagonus]